MKKGIDLVELATELQRQKASKEDYVLDTRQLQIVPRDRGVTMKLRDDEVEVIEPWAINKIAHRQIGQHLKIHATFYDRLKEDHPDILAHNINELFRREPSSHLVRTMDGTARAFLSDRYRPIDNDEIAEAVLPVLGEMRDARFESCQITPSRMYIKVINERLTTEVTPGDIVQAGIMITNSETGQGAVSVQPLIYRLVCSNGMVINDAAARRHHIGRVNNSDENYRLFRSETLQADQNAFLMKVVDTVRAAVDEAKFSQVVNIMREATGIKMETRDIPAVVKLTAKDYGMTEKEGSSVLEHLIQGGDLTKYGLANAVTRASQDMEDYDRATDLEMIGYGILTMPRKQWHKINDVA